MSDNPYPFVVGREDGLYLQDDGTMGAIGPNVRRFEQKSQAQIEGAKVNGYSHSIDADQLA